MALARFLGLPPQSDEPDQTALVEAVRRWLHSNSDWLLIFDNADELKVVRRLPSLRWIGAPAADDARSGRPDAGGSAPGGKNAGRARRGTAPAPGGVVEGEASLEPARAEDREAALVLSREFGGLPLVLDQAGAFILEMGSGPAEYLSLYQEAGQQLRRAAGSSGEPDHASVTTTFSLVLARVRTSQSDRR